jgi:mono/diheme cytochrome c family protein
MILFVNTGKYIPSGLKVLACPRPASFLRLSTVALLAATLSTSTASTASKIEYNRDIRPILSENCFACHGADSASRKANLRLDHFEQAIAPRKDSQAAIVAGKPKESLLVRRILATDDDIMPPAKTHKTLTAEQKDLLTRWVAEGAKYQPHWSFVAPVKPAVPQVKNKLWVHNPIDNFVLARLEKEGLKPSPEADRRTLARRVTLDLIGLPPKPEEVEAFVKDSSPNAYEKLVDRLLARPEYGEHRGHYWLDAARYGDTHGIHIDNYREMWSYRESVIKAFNRNQHFDQFTIEQLAGDLLPHATLDQQVASGFNRCNITTSEGGSIDEEYFVLYARDRTDTTARVWLGLTAGCAVCHDHKFDPFTQKDFYSLSAYFNNITQAAMDLNAKDTPPAVVVPADTDRGEWDALQQKLKADENRIALRRDAGKSDFTNWMGTATPKLFTDRLPQDKPYFHALLNEGEPATNEPQTITYLLKGETNKLTLKTNAAWQAGHVASKAFQVNSKTNPVAIAEVGDFARDEAFSYGAWVYRTKDTYGAFFSRMDDTQNNRGWDLWLVINQPAMNLVNKWPDDCLKVISKKEVPLNRWTHVFVTYDGSCKASGVKIYVDGKSQITTVEADRLKSSIHTTVPFRLGQRSPDGAPVDGFGIQDVRIYDRVLAPEEVQSLAENLRAAYLLGKSAERRKAGENDEVYECWLKNFDEEYQDAMDVNVKHEKIATEIQARGTEALVMAERTNSAVAYVLFRGDYDKRRDKVTPATPAALPPMPADYPSNRLGFAKWLVRPENPLTARVTVNRFWEEVFGAGIVKTAGDFGVMGELPSNQALLDWLAVDFRESGWDMKRFFRQVVMSATYRQSVATTPDLMARDPDNRLLARGPRFRMDAEMIRDYDLAASGLLVQKIGGPSVRPYQPDGVWEAVAMDVSNTRYYKRDEGENLYRRSLYTFWKRAAPPASMDIFNAPSRETCTVRRERTNTPLQALVTMNDTQFIEAARNLAQLALKQGGTKDRDRLDFMAKRLLARSLRPSERKTTQTALKAFLAQYQAEPKAAKALISVGASKADETLDQPTFAAYTMIANALMNLDEVLNK